VRTVLTSAAAEGARAAALAGADPTAGERRARTVIDETIASTAVESIATRRELFGGVPVMTVEITARLPLVGLFGPSALRVHGHSLVEHV